MNVYIVTTGSYSDYRIQRVFLSREVADKYATIINGYVEEFETSDESIHADFSSIREYTVVFFSYERHIKKNREMHVLDLQTWFESNEDLYQERITSMEEESFSIGKMYGNSFYDETYDMKSLNEDDNVNEFSVIEQIDRHRLVFRRVFEGKIDINEPFLREKYEKITHDTFAHCMSLYKQEGWNIKMINDWLQTEFPVNVTFKL